MKLKDLIGKYCWVAVKSAISSDGEQTLRYFGKITSETEDTVYMSVEGIKLSVYGKELKNIGFENVVLNKKYIVAIEY